MWKMHWLVIFAVLASGCGKSAPNGESSTAQSATDTAATADGKAQLDGPAAAAYEFLEAVRTGDDERAAKMLTATARQKATAMNQNVTPSASDTAHFTIGKIDYVNDDGARVACTWTDVDDQGKPATDEIVWVLRREQEGWRIAGVAAQVIPGEQPVMLNFEDPDDMARKKQWVREEMRRRAEAGGSQAQKEENSEKSIRR